MQILIAPDKFKESLSAQEAANAIRDGFSAVFAEANFAVVPVADGGEGTAGIFIEALGGEWVEVATHDALGRSIDASYAWMSDRNLAVIEMSAASGLWRIKPDERDPLQAHTLGTGELVADAIRRGAEHLLVGLGGSATNDAGVGMASALGWKFLDQANNPLGPQPSEFRKIRQIVPPSTPLSYRVTGLCDVSNPLLGEAGATRTFGPQKGASPEMLAQLEENLAHVARLCSEQFGKDLSLVPGAGAAGGLGFGLLTFLQAALESGFHAISRLMDLESRVSASDLVITGEGRFFSPPSAIVLPHGRETLRASRVRSRSGYRRQSQVALPR